MFLLLPELVNTLTNKAKQSLSENISTFPFLFPIKVRMYRDRINIGSQQEETKTKISKKFNRILMEPLRGIWCQFWVRWLQPKTLRTDRSEWGFHKSDFGLGSIFHSCPVLCVLSITGQNKNQAQNNLWLVREACEVRWRPQFCGSNQAPQEAANKRWRSTMSPCFILADSPISLIIMNQWKENLLKRKPFIYAAQTLMLVSREQLREPLQPPILYDLVRINSSVWRHYVCICFIFSAWILNV